MAKTKTSRSKVRTPPKTPARVAEPRSARPAKIAAKPKRSKPSGQAAAKPKRKSVSPTMRARKAAPIQPRKPVANTYQVFWSTGMLGGIMVVTAGLWSAWRTPIPAPGALAANPPAAEVALRAQRSPASADPPIPAQPETASQPQQRTQQQQEQRQQQAPCAGAPRETYEDPAIHPSIALQAAFDQATQTAPEHRVAWWSGWLTHDATHRSELKSLGPGPEIQDTAPLIPELFNCTTFVETVAALARSRKPQLFFQRLIEIRYQGGKPGYLSRNHFPEADWRPNNTKAGIISDVTAVVAQAGGATLQSEKKTLDRAEWLTLQKAGSPRIARALADAGPPGPAWTRLETVQLSFISRHDLPKVIERIPDGAVIGFVRKNEAKRPVLITHQGIVVSEGGKVWLRHGSPGGRVRSVLLRDYLRRNVGFVGFTLDQIRSDQLS